MKNRYFQKMQRNGIAFRKRIFPSQITPFNKIYSYGASLAYKYWAISERYNATDIFIDELPDENITTKELLDTFRAADIRTIVVSVENEDRIAELERLGCKLVGKCKVFRRETELYYGSLEILKGFRIVF